MNGILATNKGCRHLFCHLPIPSIIHDLHISGIFDEVVFSMKTFNEKGVKFDVKEDRLL